MIKNTAHRNKKDLQSCSLYLNDSFTSYISFPVQTWLHWTDLKHLFLLLTFTFLLNSLMFLKKKMFIEYRAVGYYN